MQNFGSPISINGQPVMHIVAFTVGIIPLLAAIILLIVNIFFAVAVLKDAQNRRERGMSVWFVPSVIWAAATLVLGPFLAVVYWAMHYTSFATGQAPLQTLRDDQQTLDETRSAAQLNALPPSASHLDIQTSRSAAATIAIISFAAPIEAIDAWLSDSIGTSSLEPRRISETGRIYDITPTKGARTIQLTVDERENRVVIRADWPRYQ